MKNLVFSSLFLFLPILLFGQVEPRTLGDEMPEFSLPLVTNPNQNLSSQDLSGKVILLDFWATWCGPCIVGMKHLGELQRTFPEQLAIVPVSKEEQDKLTAFVDRRGYDFLFVRDSAAFLQDYFPYAIIPHSVLIDPTGKVVAITDAKFITEETIRQVLRGEPIDLVLKQDNLDFDYQADYWNRDSATEQAFVIEPHIPGIDYYIQRPKEGAFANRRISFFNHPVPALLVTAFDASWYRVEYQESRFDDDDPEQLYCVDIIVPPGEEDQLLPTLRARLAENLPYQGRMELRDKDVLVLVPTSRRPAINLPPSEGPLVIEKEAVDTFKATGATVADFAAWMERYGLAGMPVLDETRTAGKSFTFDFKFDTDDPKTFIQGLETMGITFQPANRAVKTLVIE